jgi:hypothetical protein
MNYKNENSVKSHGLIGIYFLGAATECSSIG